MKKNYFKQLFISVSFLVLVSCANDPAPHLEDIDVNHQLEIEVDSTVPSGSGEKSLDKDTIVSDLAKSQTSSNTNAKQKANAENSSLSSLDQEEVRTADNLEGELNNKVNRKANPDNYNGTGSLNTESRIELVPIFKEEEKEKYYVQFLVKVHKLSKQELEKVFPDSQRVYVVQYHGLYNYCLGQFDTESAANTHKSVVEKKFSLKDAQVVTYKEAW
jgi:hypothetical protein